MRLVGREGTQILPVVGWRPQEIEKTGRPNARASRARARDAAPFSGSAASVRPARCTIRPASSSWTSSAASADVAMPVRAASVSMSAGSAPSAASRGSSVSVVGACRTRRGGCRVAGHAEFLQDVLRGLDELGALADQLVTALRQRRVDRAGNREDFAALLARIARGDQRARCSAASTTSTPCARPLIRRLRRGKFFSLRRRAGRKLGEEPAVRRRSGARDRDGAPGRRDRGRCRRPRASSPRPRARLRAPRRRCPSASPDTMVKPGIGERVRKGARVRRGPARVALRLPTIASAGRFRNSRRPTKNSTGRRVARRRAAPADSRGRPTR